MINEVRIVHSIPRQCYEMILGDRRLLTGGPSIAVMEASTMKAIEQHLPIPDECIVRIDEAGCQSMLDYLWSLGFRPANLEGTDKQVDALQNHLGDMRKIAFKKLGMEGA